MTSDAAYEAKRRAERPWRAWYRTQQWKERRRRQLEAEPDCQRCRERGLIVPATIAHHLERHNGDHDKFWYGRLRSDCKQCHDIVEQTIEARGYEIGCDESGRPLASDHPWNVQRRPPG